MTVYEHNHIYIIPAYVFSLLNTLSLICCREDTKSIDSFEDVGSPLIYRKTQGRILIFLPDSGKSSQKQLAE